MLHLNTTWGNKDIRAAGIQLGWVPMFLKELDHATAASTSIVEFVCIQVSYMQRCTMSGCRLPCRNLQICVLKAASSCSKWSPELPNNGHGLGLFL